MIFPLLERTPLHIPQFNFRAGTGNPWLANIFFFFAAPVVFQNVNLVFQFINIKH